MKRAFLQGLGLEKEVIDTILNVHGSEIENLNDQLSDLTKEKDKLQKDLKAFNGVNLEELKNQSETLKNEYEEKIKTMKIDAAIEKALGTSKAKHSDLLVGKFDREKIMIDEDGKVSGVDDQLKGLKESYKDLFEKEIKGNPPANPDDKSKTAYDDVVANANNMSTEDVVNFFNQKD